jgi:hypothetical protein
VKHRDGAIDRLAFGEGKRVGHPAVVQGARLPVSCLRPPIVLPFRFRGRMGG